MGCNAMQQTIWLACVDVDSGNKLTCQRMSNAFVVAIQLGALCKCTKGFGTLRMRRLPVKRTRIGGNMPIAHRSTLR